ncbi:hypothetical protein, partial [Paramuribaculum intestinale]|uniref:hypothetical protein n=3 Tax=Paramuribaculum intestinale TaxID=2094151 RepID=UPI0025B77665
SKISLGDGVPTDKTAFTEDMNTSISKNPPKKSKSLGNLDKKVYLCNRVVRCRKAQHTSEFALSLNRYHKIGTLLFYSDTQLDTVFLTIQRKDNSFAGAKASYDGEKTVIAVILPL